MIVIKLAAMQVVIVFYELTKELKSPYNMLWEHDAGGSNPSTPTNKINSLQELLVHKACNLKRFVSICVNLCQFLSRFSCSGIPSSAPLFNSR